MGTVSTANMKAIVKTLVPAIALFLVVQTVKQSIFTIQNYTVNRLILMTEAAYILTLETVHSPTTLAKTS